VTGRKAGFQKHKSVKNKYNIWRESGTHFCGSCVFQILHLFPKRNKCNLLFVGKTSLAERKMLSLESVLSFQESREFKRILKQKERVL
jgi:hypothetical protein